MDNNAKSDLLAACFSALAIVAGGSALFALSGISNTHASNRPVLMTDADPAAACVPVANHAAAQYRCPTIVVVARRSYPQAPAAR